MKRMEVEIKDKRLFLIFCGIFSLILLPESTLCFNQMQSGRGDESHAPRLRKSIDLTTWFQHKKFKSA